MNETTRYITLVLTVIIAENLFFGRALGSDVIMRVMTRPRDFLKFGFVLTIITVIASIVGWTVDACATALNIALPATRFTGRALIYLICIVAIYLAADRLIMRYAKTLYRSISRILPVAVFNTAVLGAPLLLTRLRATLLTGLPGSDFVIAVIFGLSLGVGFLFALLLMAEGMRQLDAMDLPEAFRGLPARFVYIGLLALAFSGIIGRQTLI